MEEQFDKFNQDFIWNNTYFVKFAPLNLRNETMRKQAIDQMKIWIQANFENVDPTFHKEWNAILKKEGLLCEKCWYQFTHLRKKDQDSDSSDSDTEDPPVRMLDDDLYLIEEMHVRKQRCPQCS